MADTLGTLTVRRLGAKKDGLVVVLCHGFGAPGDDLVPIGRALPAPAGTHFVFPEARLSMAQILGMPVAMVGPARAWWPIDMERLEKAMRGGDIRDMSRDVPEGLAESRAALLSLVDALDAEGVPSSRIVLGGFSQGSMLATDVALRDPRPFAGLVIWSGTLLCEAEWLPLMAARKALPVYMSHGDQDPILPFSVAERLRDELVAAGVGVQFRGFRGGHAIPPQVLSDVSAFLGKLEDAAKVS
jgi:phospholipase/carboxylesterase